MTGEKQLTEKCFYLVSNCSGYRRRPDPVVSCLPPAVTLSHGLKRTVTADWNLPGQLTLLQGSLVALEPQHFMSVAFPHPPFHLF